MTRSGLGRALAIVTLAAAVAGTVAVILRGGDESYRLSLRMANASQLVRGDRVTIGGVSVGTVDRISLTADGQARVDLDIQDDDVAPLHRGTTATVRVPSLSGVANRYVALSPGPNSAPALPDGATLAVIAEQAGYAQHTGWIKSFVEDEKAAAKKVEQIIPTVTEQFLAKHRS